VNRLAAMVQLLPREGFDLARVRAAEQRLGDDYEYNFMRGTPSVMRRRMLLSPSRMPCTPPPFGTLVAISLKTGSRLWEVPLGTIAALTGDPVRALPEWGSPNLGGPIVTAGGLVFIGAALDRSLHAFDIENGREVWRGSLPESGKATPMSYRLASGEQFVAIAVGGGGAWGAGDSVVAFHLRREEDFAALFRYVVSGFLTAVASAEVVSRTWSFHEKDHSGSGCFLCLVRSAGRCRQRRQ